MGAAILGMLHRDPAQRATLKAVYTAWKHMLQADTSTVMPTVMPSVGEGEFETHDLEDVEPEASAPASAYTRAPSFGGAPQFGGTAPPNTGAAYSGRV